MSIFGEGVNLVRGSELSAVEQRQVLSAYVHRHTGDHKPHWAMSSMLNGNEYPVQFADDLDWLANTEFAVNKSGSLNKRVKECLSHPTWPNNPELRHKAH